MKRRGVCEFHRPADHGHCAGWVFVELAVGATLLIAALVGIVEITAHSVSSSGDRVVAAQRACYGRLHDLRTMPEEDLPSRDGTRFYLSEHGIVGQVGIVVERRTATRAIYRLNVRARWSDWRGPRTFEISALR